MGVQLELLLAKILPHLWFVFAFLIGFGFIFWLVGWLIFLFVCLFVGSHYVVLIVLVLTIKGSNS